MSLRWFGADLERKGEPWICVRRDCRLREEARAALEDALHEVKRVIVGQDGMLERLVVALLAGGHVLLEGVPGLARRSPVKTLADVLGGSFAGSRYNPTSCPPIWSARGSTAPAKATSMSTRAGFGKFLLADRDQPRPGEVQSALLEVHARSIR